ncbi:hypothetical protein CH063_05493 [Colletotrichum higginsianum]|uniref:NmrA-like domain-containing protein n=1 Tax=Colletotrichum higginsianum (strain IMI 349063) TaxID=759273 RepID=H1UZ73_COLHI|nr:hypothetical protein ColKHC_11306 [Colletotrichum higginsianum]CCF33274.1 hypothetical protein CH063_05493 [Colletotrichum higginsianum]
MAQQLKNVVLAGSTGNAGSKILQSLVDSGQFNVTVLVRKPEVAHAPGVTVKTIDFGSMAALVEVLKGQDAVIDATMSPDATMPLRMIDAAVSAGVKRFIPSEFSLDPNNPLTRSVPVFGPKNQVLSRLKDLASTGRLTYTTISNGAFLDWNLRTGFIKINIKNKKVELMDGGDVVIPWTLLDHVGRATANVLLHAEQTKNRSVYISTVEKSQKEMFKLAQEALGSDGWTVSSLDMGMVYQESLREMKAGNLTFEVFGNMILYCNSRLDYSGKWEKDDNALLGIQPWSDEEVRQLIRSIASE